MAYKTGKERVNEIIEKLIIPTVHNKDVDYEKAINFICMKSGVSRNIVEGALKEMITVNKMKEIHILTIPDEDIDGFLKEVKIKEEEMKKEEKEIEDLLK